MLPPLKTVKAGLRHATETLARELAKPGGAEPAWNELEWRLAMAVSAAHGPSPLLQRSCAWRHPAWRSFLAEQREHVAQRHQRIAELLERIDAGAHMAGLPVVALKGSALHAMGLYAAGDRPMADVDLLVREADVERAAALLRGLGYAESFAQWKHRTFKPGDARPTPGLGEHRDTPVNIELHTCIQERLPVATVDVTARIMPAAPRPGLNGYPSPAALMAHLLLHAAGNLCGRSMRLIHLHDIALLAARLQAADWQELLDGPGGAPWWALPPLRLAARYYGAAIPGWLLERLAPHCPPWLRALSRRHDLTRVSCSELWLHALAGLEWARSPREVARYLGKRIRPGKEAAQERADMVRTQLWLQGQHWVTASHRRRVLTWLTKPVPRMDTLYVVRAALDHPAPAAY